MADKKILVLSRGFGGGGNNIGQIFQEKSLPNGGGGIGGNNKKILYNFYLQNLYIVLICSLFVEG